MRWYLVDIVTTRYTPSDAESALDAWRERVKRTGLSPEKHIHVSKEPAYLYDTETGNYQWEFSVWRIEISKEAAKRLLLKRKFGDSTTKPSIDDEDDDNLTEVQRRRLGLK